MKTSTKVIMNEDKIQQIEHIPADLLVTSMVDGVCLIWWILNVLYRVGVNASYDNLKLIQKLTTLTSRVHCEPLTSG